MQCGMHCTEEIARGAPKAKIGSFLSVQRHMFSFMFLFHATAHNRLIGCQDEHVVSPPSCHGSLLGTSPGPDDLVVQVPAHPGSGASRARAGQASAASSFRRQL